MKNKKKRTFIGDIKHYGLLTTIEKRYPNLPLWISIFALIVSVVAPILRIFLIGKI